VLANSGIDARSEVTGSWPEMSTAAPAWFEKATIVTLHNGVVVQALR
jgi:hypothetical protein